jgi:hypothetical protein
MPAAHTHYMLYCCCCALLQVLFNLDIDCCSVHEAAANSHSGCLQTLLSRDSSTAVALDDSQQSVLRAVAHLTQYCTDLTRAALQALQQQQQLSDTINLQNSEGDTALQLAIRTLTAGDEIAVCHGCFRLLLAAGADISSDILEYVLRERSVCFDLYPEQHCDLIETISHSDGATLRHTAVDNNSLADILTPPLCCSSS